VNPPILVLVEPQDLVNIAAAVRVAKNFGLTDVRLVNPREYDAWRVEGIAHNTADLLGRLRLTATLDEALADCVYSVALTARERRAKRSVLRPRAAAASLLDRSGDGPVAIVAGREDKGLTNEELDRCHALVTIPTNPDYRSLNLAQAICVLCYESMLASAGLESPLKPPRRRADMATGDQQERLFGDWQRALETIDFFKTRQPEFVMRSLREIFFRADLDGREATLLRAMALEVVRFLERERSGF
jgi:tRNA (cytidine32/uridine32-2'-O)-methyltransferase